MALSSHDPSPDFVEEMPWPIEVRDHSRNRRAHAYLRRRLLNNLMLLLGSLVAWGLLLFLLRLVFPYWSALRLDPVRLTVLGLLHITLMFNGRLLPGWGEGIVNELRSLTLATVSVIFLEGLTEFLSLRQWTVLPLTIGVAFVAALLQMLLRSLIKTLLLRGGIWGVPAVIYGAGLTGRKVLMGIQSEPGLGYQVQAFFDDNPALHGQHVAGLPVVGNTRDWAIEAPVAILAMPGAPRGTQSTLIDGPLSVYRNVIVIPELFDVQTLWTQSRDLGGMLGVQISHNLADPLTCRFKRALDLALTLGSAPLWLPLCGLIALFIWLEDRQSPLFLQDRIGLGGKTFKTWKFRTMVPQAEQILQQRLAADPELHAEWEANFKLRKDPRITRIGNVLRKTSLDELPQLVNVLRGDMALVGPRPLPSYHQRELPLNVQRLRYEVRPGMTGLWQVSGRSDAGNEGMIQLDPYYVRNWSIWLDAVILLRTFRAVLRSAGAY